MVDHRRTVARAPYVPSSWVLVLTVMLCLGGAGWLGWLLVDGESAPVDQTAAPASSSAPAPTATASESPVPQETEETEEAPEPEETEEAPDEVEVARDIEVSVLNNSGIQGAARAFSAKVTGAGWTLGGVGNWTGSIGANTVYYPPGQQDRATLLGQDVGIERILPSVAPMRTDRLTIILSGPQ